MKRILQTIMAEPLILPKSFFENRKHLSIQLTTEPMLSEQKPVTLQTNEDLVIKFEGLVKVSQHEKSKIIKEVHVFSINLCCFINRTREKDQEGYYCVLCDQRKNVAFR